MHIDLWISKFYLKKSLIMDLLEFEKNVYLVIKKVASNDSETWEIYLETP